MNTEKNNPVLDHSPKASLSISIEGEDLRVIYSGKVIDLMATVLFAIEKDKGLEKILTSAVGAFNERKNENLQS